MHWLLAGIPPRADGIDAGERPTGSVVGRNGFGENGYGGPEPPVGDDPHRYFFLLYALREPSGLALGFAADELADLRKNALAVATLVGRYSR